METTQTDSRLVYIVCHLMCWVFNVAMLTALVWLSHDLRSAWPLAAMVFANAYNHDFNRVKSKNQNASNQALTRERQ